MGSGCHPARLGALALLMVGVATLSQPAQAQGRGQTIPVGGRSALLGGTGVAAGTDASVPLLNPAGILAVDSGLLSFATRFVRIGVRELDKFRQIGTPISDAQVADPDVTDVSFVVRPSGTCYFGRILSGPDGSDKRPHKFSFCVYQSERENASVQGGLATTGGPMGRTDLSTSVTSEWRRNHFGIGWATPLGKRAAIGLSSFTVQTSLNLIDVAAGVHDQPTLNGSTYLFTLSASNFQLVNRIGLTIDASRHLKMGASVRAPGLHLLSSGETITSQTSSLGSTNFIAGEGSFMTPLPAQVALGLAMKTRNMHLELNGFFELPGTLARFKHDREAVQISGDGIPQPAPNYEEQARGRTSLAFGGEYAFNDSYTALSGVSTNFSSLVPRDPTKQQLFPVRRDAINGSIGFGAQGPLGRVLAGARVEYLFGEMLVPTTTGERLVVDDDEWSVMLIFSGQVRVADALRSAKKLIIGE